MRCHHHDNGPHGPGGERGVSGGPMADDSPRERRTDRGNPGGGGGRRSLAPVATGHDADGLPLKPREAPGAPRGGRGPTPGATRPRASDAPGRPGAAHRSSPPAERQVRERDAGTPADEVGDEWDV